MTEIDLLAAAYPPLLVFAAALIALVAPRAVGAAAGAASLLAVVAVSLLAPGGAHLTTTFLGFADVEPFLVDDLTRMMGLALGFLGAFAVLYAYSSGVSRVLMAFALAYVASALGAAFAGDWLVLVFMWEIMAITSTLLVWHYRGKAVRAGYRYAIAHGIGGNLVLFAVVWHYAVEGTFVFVEAGGDAVVDGGIAAGAPMLLAALGIGINCAFVGFHTWLPDTYPKPHFATSVFLSVFTTKTSAYVLLRAFPEGSLYLAYMGGLMAVYGVCFALLQHDMRALLSYHIQAQVGYMVAGIGIGSYLGAAAAMGHLFNNVLYKSLLFMAVGVVIYRTGKNDLYKLGGLWREMPLTAVAFFVGALSITAVPGFSGFISKGMVLDAAAGYFGDAGPEYRALYWLLFIGAIGTFLSFIKLGYYVFFHGESDFEVPDARPGQTVAMFTVGAACVALGLWWQGFANVLPLVEGTTVVDVDGDLHPYSVGHLQDALVLIVVSAVGFKLIRKPLSKLELDDPAFVLHPITFYTGRVSMRAVTETFAAVDSLAVGFVRRCYWIGNNPVLAVDAAARRLPVFEVDEKRRPANGGRPSRLHLRAGIGTTILLVTVVLTVVLWLLV